MPNPIRITLVLCAAAFLVACSRPAPAPQIEEPAPITQEPTYTGKYK